MKPEEMKSCDMRFGTFDEWLGKFISVKHIHRSLLIFHVITMFHLDKTVNLIS